MKVFVAALCLAVAVSAVPEGRRLRPEEHWRPATARDMSKYQPKPMPKADALNKAGSASAASVRKFMKSVLNKPLPQGPQQYDLAAECGIEGPPAKGRIVGGEEAEENQWPWIVALFIDDAWFCGGSLINENWVLTAAHCVEDAFYFDVQAGAHNVYDHGEPNRVEITSFVGFTHPDWDHNTLENDVALIQLPEAITFNDYIRPSCLPSAGNALTAGDMVSVIGWGKPSDSASSISQVLRMVHDIPVISNDECNDYYGIIQDGIVCIDTTGGRGSCNGDSGGPLIQKDGSKASGQKWNQVGVVSFGSSRGCEVGAPAGFSRTEFYLDWIMSNTNVKY